MSKAITGFCCTLLLSSLAWAAEAPGFEAARSYKLGGLTVEVGRPTLFTATAGEGADPLYSVHVPLRVDNRLGRTVSLDRASTFVLDRNDHPLTFPAVFRGNKPIDGDPEIKNSEKLVLQLFFDTAHPALLDRFDLHWTVQDRGKAVQEITHYKAARLPGPAMAAAAAATPPTAPMSDRRTDKAMRMLASYHFYRDLLHGDLLGSSMDPPSGLPWSTVSVTSRQLPLEIDVLGL